MNIRAAVLAALLTCGFSLPASADEPGCQRPQLNEAEGNADGGITAEKHAASAAKRFEMMDKDHNGRITRDEIEASHGAESIVWANHPESDVQKIRDLDTNRDGVLTPEEMVLDPRSR